MMLSAGYLLEDLDASDRDIVEWLARLGNPARWARERAGGAA
jgi:hypothetical protein